MTIMRWWGWAMACALLASAGAAAEEAKTLQLTRDSPPVRTLVVSGVCSRGASAALGALAAEALAKRGVSARPVTAPPACGQPTGRGCIDAILRSLVRGTVHAALVPVPSARPLPVLMLRDAGLEELGDAAPPMRLACHAFHPPHAYSHQHPRSLLDFAEDEVAAQYQISDQDITAETDTNISSSCTSPNCTSVAFEPSWCFSNCSTLLTSDLNEAAILSKVIQDHRLRIRIRTFGSEVSTVANALAQGHHAVLVCDQGLDLDPHFELLGPPPCTSSSDCPFESYRLVKVVNARELAYSPSALRVLGKLSLSEIELGSLVHAADGADEGVAKAISLVSQHSEWTGLSGEARVAVLLPTSSHRDAFDATALQAAAILAEGDAAHYGGVSFKVEVVDDGCAATLAFKYLTDALGAEYGALAGVAGPACGAAFADVARQSAALALPVLAYSVQAPPTETRASVLLGGGDARQIAPAWAAVLAHMRWHRVAVLSELATRAALRLPDLDADVLVHVELPADGDQLDYELIEQWAERAQAAGARILVVSAEDARVVRAAACAAQAVGLSAAKGAAWLLPALPQRWARPTPYDVHNCTRNEITSTTDGHLMLLPAWQVDWDDDASNAKKNWSARWHAQCVRTGRSSCTEPGAHSALLYDVVRLWAKGLQRLLGAAPAALDDLHQPHVIRSLMEYATGSRYTGLTGDFEWSGSESVRARTGALVLIQTLGGSRRRVGRVEGGRLAFSAELRWPTEDGTTPDDGGARCALQPLADALAVECGAALGLAAALVLALLVASLAVAGLYCKRRAERRYHDRLRRALDLRALNPKPGDLDRWEIPRERVVINRKLGTGAFGTVYGGHALLAEDRGWTAVAVKTLKPGATTDEKLDFLSEAEAMKCFDHKNVVRLLGVVTKTEPVCTVMEFMLYGDLKSYLLARRHLVGSSGDAGDEVSPARLTSMALGAARGLSYLAQQHYVHRDVAARNCLVSANRVLKLADFGMTRLVYENDYYRFSRKGMLPVRWMAPESLALGVFSPASDVWSFGVLLYEVVTFGSLPFQGLSNAEVLTRVKEGHTLDLPAGLKPQLEGLIKSCWQQQAKARPSAAEVAAFLADWPRLLAPCLDVPLDALPLARWRRPSDRVAHAERSETRWVSWAAPPSATTDTTYLSADGAPRESDAFLPEIDAFLPETSTFLSERNGFIPESETFLS